MQSDLPHVPVLRAGREYRSLSLNELRDHRNGRTVALASEANAGLVRRDLRAVSAAARELRMQRASELVERCVHASELFRTAPLELSEGRMQTPEEYLELLSATGGLPLALARANLERVAGVMREMPAILAGLLRGLELDALDSLAGEQDGIPVWFAPCASSLGVILPSNSPGVNALWIPALALKVPVVLKPGRHDPWTPLRVVRALIAAGFPASAFGFYPTDHEGSAAILEGADRSLLFGDEKTTRPWANRSSIEIHGPGRSKLIFGRDELGRWREHLDVLVRSIAENGGRSCVNASCIVVSERADEIADALAARLAEIAPRAASDPEARLAAFPDPAVAQAIDAAIEASLGAGGARDVTREHRRRNGASDARRVERDGASYLLPTLVRCSREHPLANTEFLFPFASVVEVEEDAMLDWMGESLVVTAITRDRALTERLIACPTIGRLNLGPVPTNHVRWDQPHEGNLFELFYERRAFHRAAGWDAGGR